MAFSEFVRVHLKDLKQNPLPRAEVRSKIRRHTAVLKKGLRKIKKNS